MMKRTQKAYGVIALLVLAGFGSYFLGAQEENSIGIAQVHHQSQFFRYSEFIENAVGQVDRNIKIDLDEVRAGVVPHHIPTTIPLLAEFYVKLRDAREVKTFVILAPDHIDAGRGNISVSKADFVMPFGTLYPNLAVIEKLEASGFVVQDEGPFVREHSIDSQLLLISRIFPEAQIVPLVFRSSLTNEEARAFGRTLATIVDEDTFIVGSVDFSHYLTARQARAIDYLSANILSTMNSRSTELLEADSEQALVALMSYLEARGVTQHTELQVFNTKDFNDNNDYTTGYVTGFWGSKGEPAAQLDEDETITLLFTGDIMLSRLIGETMKRKNDWRYPFLAIADLTREADLTFGNLEGPVSSRGTDRGSLYSFRADPRSIEGLLFAGFDVLSIANNHSWDYGPDAVVDTILLLGEAGIGVVGGGENYLEAHQPLLRQIKDTKIAFLAYTDLIPSSIGSETARPAIAYLDKARALVGVGEASQKADLVVVSLHWGEEYETSPNHKQETLAKSLIESGADLIIGHHPHVIQPVVEYGGGYIAYSLGNLVFDQNFSEDTRSGLILKVTVKDKKISAVEKVMVKFTPSYQPHQPVEK